MIEDIEKIEEGIDGIIDSALRDTNFPNRPINGRWISEAGSVVELRSSGSVLFGTFTRKGEEPHRLIGSIDDNPSQPGNKGLALSFSVFWPSKEAPSYRSVTSYTGQYHPEENFISTVFLLANETLPSKDYASVFVGYDVFKRS